MSKKILALIILVIVIALGLGGFWFWRDAIFSKEILKIEILGPEEIKMGDEIEYTVKYKNNGNFVLESPKLFFELPENSLTEDGKHRISQDLEDIYPGVERFVTFKARLLGKEGDVKSARAWLSYKPKNLSVRYESDTTLLTKINTVPITLTYDMPSRVEKGKEITYAINYFSNIDYPLEDLSIKIEPVNGFTINSSDPASLDQAEWKLDTLNKSKGGRITIRGAASGDTGNDLHFVAKLGMWVDGTFVVIKEATHDVQVIQSQLFISQQINGSSNYTAAPGEMLNYDIFIRNIGSTAFDNIFAVARIEGAAYDLSTLQSSDGQAKANDTLIVWDSKQVSKLQRLNPQQEVKVSFQVKLKDALPDPSAQTIKNKVNVFDISQEFATKITAKLQLAQRVYRANQQGFQNSGPIPPQVNKATTYIVTWQIKNDVSEVKNIKVKAILPQGVTLGDDIVPEDQISHFSLDSATREIVWTVGNLAPGMSSSLAFQIALTPTMSQKGMVAPLIGQATIWGEDQFTSAFVQGTSPAVNTSLPDDRGNSGGGIVQ